MLCPGMKIWFIKSYLLVLAKMQFLLIYTSSSYNPILKRRYKIVIKTVDSEVWVQIEL